MHLKLQIFSAIVMIVYAVLSLKGAIGSKNSLKIGIYGILIIVGIDVLRSDSFLLKALNSVDMDFFDIIWICIALFFIYAFRSDKAGTFMMSAILFFEGFASINGYKVWHKYQGWVMLGIRGKILVFIMAFVSLFAFLFGKKSNQNKIFFCKKCQKTFYFYDVTNLRCKRCFEKLADYEHYLKQKYAHKNEILVDDEADESKPRKKNNKKRKKRR